MTRGVLMFRTLFGKLLIALLAFGVMMIAIFAVVMQWSHEKYHLELDQRAASALAGRIVAQGIGFDAGGSALQSELERIAAINTGVDLYVLDEQGKVLASSIAPARVERDRVDMTPLRRYLQADANLPILGADPSDPSRNDVFSIAAISGGKQQGTYLYALLHRREHQDGAGLIRAGYLLGEGAWLVGAGALFAVVSAGVIVRLLTRRLRRLTTDIEQFRLSGFTEPPDGRTEPHAEPQDEVGRLGRAFAEMAQLIVLQMRELKRTDAMRRELLASISHDLRAPLASMQGHLETLVLKEATLSADDRQEYLEITTRQTRRMAKLVSRIFDLAMLEARQMPFAPEPFALPDVVHDVMQKFSLAATQKGVGLRADIPERLPLVSGDAGLIERVFDNLVENALRHTARGGAVRVHLAPAKQGIAVAVSDTGNGIASEHMARIFERFFPGHEQRPPAADGGGLGLMIVKSVLELHGSEIRVVSAVGVGTTFRFEIPVRRGILPARVALEPELTGPIRLRPDRSYPKT
jgi:signal transduction histidine kinase